MNYTDFAIVILNWNGQSLLERFLPSIVAHSGNASIYIIDNGSTDNSVHWLNSVYSEILQVNLSENLGYAGGYQEGLKHIKAKYYCLLNSDIEVTKDWLNPIQNLFENSPKIAAIQPKIVDFNNKEKFEYAGAAGGFLDRYGYPFCRGRIFDSIERDEGQFNDETPIFWASGACFFIRAVDFWNAGGLDKDYFAHQEEIDLCWRLFNQHKQVYYTSKSTVFHVGGASLAYQNPQKTFLNFRNSLYTLVKNAYGKRALLLILTRMILDGVAGIQFLVTGKWQHLLAILKAHFHFYKQLPSLLKKRKKIQQQKRNFTTRSIVFDYYIKGRKTF